MTYTTQDLITILEQELRATWQGKRVLLSSASRLDNPVIAKAINLQKVGRVFAYQDFRQQIHEYQRQHQVSGIIWRSCQFQGHGLLFPECHNQLIAIEGDKEILMQAKAQVIEFWQARTVGMQFWLAAHHRRPLSPDTLAELIQDSEWAELDATQTELFLGLCWGNPQEYQYLWAKPASGCHRIIAAHQEPSAIKV
ncbi:MAG: hypothetical protein ACKO1W_12360 [Microcystaceae cyanobacterium]